MRKSYSVTELVGYAEYEQPQPPSGDKIKILDSRAGIKFFTAE